ncbi:putative membrane protein [Wickerhamomyces ciferrii]|uniref:Membrane protein n=1 Tax=Wickerhamomyces ciferrii (strain ATCC 14091 / BCRC 22168 / CBS 111 / JCM 3599 / NBRC 0793 / NRRL Y-1031 F-60-10) TaxID=1206466 RepID=K0KVH8_WICCF|nr:uncharacterized protein BN7_5046 [Wickerhamomyces ciferrii]CCH45464.1 putative membrane protein [Wickerhamomyces ciferrii]
MASPIFVSNPSPTFSLTAIVKGYQFAILGGYRLLQNQFFFENPKYFKFTLVALQLSIFVQILLSIPNYVLKVVYYGFKFFLRKEIEIDWYQGVITILIEDVLQVQPMVLLIIYTFYCDVFEDIFNSGLQYIDQVTIASHKKPKLIYSTGLIKLKRVELRKRSTFTNLLSKLEWLSISQINHLSYLFRSYLQLISGNLFLVSVSFLPYIGSPLVSFIVSRNFNSKLGSSLTLLFFIIGLIIPTEAVWKLYAFYYTTQFIIKAILNIPYFQKLNFSIQQCEDWLDSRAGLSFGFGSIFFFLEYEFNYIALVILFLQQLSIAYFITQVTDPVPDTLNEPWILTQIYWTRIYNKLLVSSDGFKPIPLSYIIFKQGETSPDTSSFVTPISSNTNLSELNEQ